MTRVLGIDPGQKSGIALYEKGALVSLETIGPLGLNATIWQACPDLLVYEDSRLQSYTWTARGKANTGVALKTARSLGQIDAWCSLIVAACEGHGIPARGVSPKEKGAKIDHPHLQALTGWAGKSNQHERDAAMLAWPYRNWKHPHG